MELHIERIKHQHKKEELTSEKVAILPYATGKHEIEGLGSIEMKISKFSQSRGAEKVVFISEALKTKNSEGKRRVVKFPRDYKVSVSQDVNPEERLVFKRVREKLK